MFIALFAIHGCSKSHSSSNNNGSGAARDTLLGTVSAYIDNSLVQFDAVAFASDQVLSNGNVLTIQAVNVTGSVSSSIQFTLSVPQTIAIGTYTPYTQGVGALEFVYTSPTLASYNNTNYSTASLTLTSFSYQEDSVVKGSFTGGVVTGSMTSPASHTITDGKFNVQVKN
jgi:hypothetical protein